MRGSSRAASAVVRDALEGVLQPSGQARPGDIDQTQPRDQPQPAPHHRMIVCKKDSNHA